MAQEGPYPAEAGAGAGVGPVPDPLGNPSAEHLGQPSDIPPKPTCFERQILRVAFVVYHLLLFVIDWFFGQEAFDQDGDGDFDMVDVQVYLVKRGLIKHNFAKYKKEEQERLQQEGAARGPREGPSNVLDRNNDGQVDIADILCSDVSRGVEDKAFEDLRTGRKFPFFVCFQILITFVFWLVFAIIQANEGKGELVTLKGGLDTLDDYMYDLRLTSQNCEDYRPQAWRWFTYQFTHIGSAHVLMNCFMVAVLGIPLEGQHGGLRMFTMFNVGVLGGAACYFVGDAHNAVVGMSGGCYALMGIGFADLIMNWGEKRYRKPTLFFLLLLIGVDLVAYHASLSSEQTSHTAHTGGFIAGILIGIVTVKNVKKHKWERILKIVSIIVGLILLAFCLVWLFTHWGPENIFEAMRGGADDFCWTRQIWNPSINVDTWVCVQCQCGDETCKTTWNAEQHIKEVSLASCENTLIWHTKC